MKQKGIFLERKLITVGEGVSSSEIHKAEKKIKRIFEIWAVVKKYFF
jgi:hypothetical protein